MMINDTNILPRSPAPLSNPTLGILSPPPAPPLSPALEGRPICEVTGGNMGLHYHKIYVKYSFVHRYSGNAQIYGLKCSNWEPVYII